MVVSFQQLKFKEKTMGTISGNPKSLRAIFSEDDGKNGYLIPSYQRPYSWTEDECGSLWDDLISYALPNPDALSEFDENGTPYFLGTMVVFPKDHTGGRLEIIDGQQRLTSISLLLRAFLTVLDYGEGRPAEFINDIKKMLWVVDKFGKIDEARLKLDSAVAMDTDWEEYRQIILSGNVPPKTKSNYAINYEFFLSQVKTLNVGCVKDVVQRIIDHCQILPIKAEGQDCEDFALKIFATLNDRGLPLSDSDIFKSVLFQANKATPDKGEDFIKCWRRFEGDCRTAFWWAKGSATDEAFSQYMYYLRACNGITDVTTRGMRSFYRDFGVADGGRRSGFEVLKKENTFADIQRLVAFWNRVAKFDSSLGGSAIKQLWILRFAPNRMWTYFVSVYFLSNGIADIEEEPFAEFLHKICIYSIAYAIYRPGVNQLRKPFYREMVKLANGQDVDFAEDKLAREKLMSDVKTYQFLNGRPVTKSMLVWYAFSDPSQLVPADAGKVKYDIEHIYAKKRQAVEHGLSDEAMLDAIGNKSILERTINVRATDYPWNVKRKIYRGEWEGWMRSHVCDLVRLAELPDFTEASIVKRTSEILDQFVGAVAKEGLLKV